MRIFRDKGEAFLAGILGGAGLFCLLVIMTAPSAVVADTEWETLIAGLLGLAGGSAAFIAARAQIRAQDIAKLRERREVVAARLEIAVADLVEVQKFFQKWEAELQEHSKQRRRPQPITRPIGLERLVNNIGEFEHPHRRWLANLFCRAGNLEDYCAGHSTLTPGQAEMMAGISAASAEIIREKMMHIGSQMAPWDPDKHGIIKEAADRYYSRKKS